MYKQCLTATVVALPIFATATSAVAQGPVDAEPVVVTASRMAETKDQTLAAVSVITREDIERIQPQSLVEVLRLQPGVDITRNGGLGQGTSVFLRGTNSDHTLVLIDGVRASSATTGSFAWEHLDPAQIERIEIVRGPRASMYGSDAIGGVIQIFTRTPEGPSARASYGSYDTTRFDAGWGGGDAVRLSVNASRTNSNGFSSQNEAGASFDPDDDGYENTSFTGRFSAPLGDKGKLEIRGWHGEGELEFDQGTQDSLNETAQARITHDTTSTWRQRFTVGFATDDLVTESSSPSTVTTYRRSANWQHEISLNPSNLLTIGLDFHEDEAKNVADDTNTVQFNREIDNTAVYANWKTRYADNDLELAARYDDHSEFGSETTGQLAWGRDLGGGTRAVLSYGTAFKAPTINQLFHPGFFGGSFAGNPDLEPETSQSWEASLRHRERGKTVEVNVFYTKVDDLIAFEGTNFQAINIDEATIKGMEVIYDQTFDAWHLGANLTLQRARDEGDDDPLLRRPDEKVTFDLGRDLPGGATANAEIVLVGERADVFGTTLNAYGLVNLTAQYPLTKRLELEGRVENLFDRDYQLVDGYNTPGASVYAAIRYTPGRR